MDGFHSARDILKILGADVFHRLVDFGLAFLCLFFFYKDGEALTRQITAVGSHFLRPERWGRYAQRFPLPYARQLTAWCWWAWPKGC